MNENCAQHISLDAALDAAFADMLPSPISGLNRSTYSKYSTNRVKPLTLSDMKRMCESLCGEIPMVEAARWVNIAKEDIEGNFDYNPLRHTLKPKNMNPRFAKTKFKVGDRVIVIQPDPLRPHLLGEHGVVRRIHCDCVPGYPEEMLYLVEFDNHMNGHDGNGLGRMGYFWLLGSMYLLKETIGEKAKKGGIMSALSTLAKRTFDADSKALVEVGALDSSLRLANCELVLEMLVAVFKKELAIEARARLKEAKAESVKA